MAEQKSTGDLAPLLGQGSPSAIPNNYIVSLKDADQVAANMSAIRQLFAAAGGENKIKNEFNIGQFHAFSATMTDSFRDEIRALPSVKYVEYDQSASTSSPPLAPLLGTASSSNKYIVSFKEELTAQEAEASLVTVKELFAKEGGDNKVEREFSIGTFRAFSATMTDSVRDRVRALPFVKHVEYDQVFSIGDPAVGPV